ncbi:MAG: hypothetical protein IIY49_10745 [Eubacterium sp.]|nr:hypothetical protein [Eubacterium sp.]
MIQNVAAVVVIIIFLVELYFSAAGAAHRKKKIIKGWNKTKGIIKAIEKKNDPMARKNYTELTIEGPDGRTVYAKVSGMFNIYEIDEEVELMEKDGYHRFVGNDRVDKKGKKEQLIGILPILLIILIAGILSIVF